VKTARDALFLAELPASLLPYVFLGVGVLTSVAAVGYARFTQRRPTWLALEWATWVSALALGIGAYLFSLGHSWVPVVFYLWVNVYGLILMSQFWSYTHSASNPREAKRIFGLIGTGGILGGLCGGLVAPPLAQAFGLPALLLLAAGLLALAAPMVRASVPPGEPPVLPERVRTTDTRNPMHHPYVRWLAVAALCSVLVTTLLDFLFKVEIQTRYGTAEDLASFLGLFYTATNLAALTMQLFATRWALQVLGAGWSAAVLPTGLGIGAVAMLITPGFGAVVGTRLWDQVMRLSINKSAVELFFFPVPTDLRRRAKAWIEAGLERLGDGFAGVLILAAGMTLGATPWTIALIVAVLIVVWVTAWMVLRRAYVVELGRNLKRMNLGSRQTQVSLRESSALDEMTRLLASPYERIVLHGLEMLRDNAPELVPGKLEALMRHDSARVRARAATLVGESQLQDLMPRIESLIHEDEDPAVRVNALRAYCALTGESSLAALDEYLTSNDARLRRSALMCIAEYATLEEEGQVRAVFERMLQGDGEDRMAVAEALGRRPIDSTLLDMIRPLFTDASLAVRNAAFESAGRTRRRTLIPDMIQALSLRESQSAARRGLAHFGDGIVGTLGDYLGDASVPMTVRRELPRVFATIGTQQAVDAMFRYHGRDDVRLSYRMLKAANQIRSRQTDVRFSHERVGEDIEFDVRSHLFALVHYRSCPIGTTRTAERLLCIALNERMDQSLDRIFRRLALIYPASEIHATYRGVTSSNPRMRGNALEYLELGLSAQHAGLILPLVDDSGDEGRLRFAEQRFGMRYIGVVESLNALLEGDDPWLRTCALFVAGSRRERSLTKLIDHNLMSPHALVRETALWARTALATG